jgi:hypothetical protein
MHDEQDPPVRGTQDAPLMPSLPPPPPTDDLFLQWSAPPGVILEISSPGGSKSKITARTSAAAMPQSDWRPNQSTATSATSPQP